MMHRFSEMKSRLWMAPNKSRARLADIPDRKCHKITKLATQCMCFLDCASLEKCPYSSRQLVLAVNREATFPLGMDLCNLNLSRVYARQDEANKANNELIAPLSACLGCQLVVLLLRRRCSCPDKAQGKVNWYCLLSTANQLSLQSDCTRQRVCLCVCVFHLPPQLRKERTSAGRVD